jgi:hypothetical protein
MLSRRDICSLISMADNAYAFNQALLLDEQGI